MPTILRDLPFFDRPTSLIVRGGTVLVKRDQIVVWVSLTTHDVEQPDPNMARLPAVLDTGCNHSFVCREEHLFRWAGIHPRQLRGFAPVKVYGALAPQFALNVWLHPNATGQRDAFADRAPFRMEIDQGIAVIPNAAGHGNPRLPLLGLRAFRRNHLQLAIDGYRRSVTIRTRRRFWLFG